MNLFWNLDKDESTPFIPMSKPTGTKLEQCRELIRRCEEREARAVENALASERSGDHEATWFAMAGRAENTRFLERLRADLIKLEAQQP